MEPSNQEKHLISVLDRQVACDALGALVSAIRRDSANIALPETAIALDASVFLRLSTHRDSADIVDYLVSRHSAPLILPGQAIQEFWNNQLHVVETMATSLKKQFDGFKAVLAKIERNHSEYVEQIESLLEKFTAEYGHIYDESTNRKTLQLLETLSRRAVVPYARRLLYRELAKHRKSTNTPPGFKDEGDGDFYTWVDLLTGLLQARESGVAFSRLALITLDKKIDWTRSGVAHPILIAEVKALLNVPFEIWTTDQLAAEIARAP